MLKCTISKVRAFRKLTRQLCPTAHPFLQEYQMLYDPNNGVYPGKMHIMTFPKPKDLKRLEGIDVDVAAVTKTFKQMKFDVSSPVVEDLTIDGLNKKLKAIEEEDFSKHSSLICMFNGHGTEDYIMVRDGAFKVDDILNIFQESRNKSLFEKPKIFIFDACRGSKSNEVNRGIMQWKAQTDNTLDVLSPTALRAADYLICYASTKGFVSYMIENGSAYTQELTKILEEHFRGNYEQKVDILQLLTKVSANVANKLLNGKTHQNGAKQMPCFVSSLRKQLYLPTTSDINCK